MMSSWANYIFNSYPYSPFANLKGIKEIIGKSKSIKLNIDMFISNCSIGSNWKIVNIDNIKSRDKLIKYGERVNKTKLYTSIFRESTTDGFCDVFIEEKVIKGKRTSGRDERLSILTRCCDFTCLKCNKKLNINKNYKYNFNCFYFKERAESFCIDCLGGEDKADRLNYQFYSNDDELALEMVKTYLD